MGAKDKAPLGVDFNIWHVLHYVRRIHKRLVKIWNTNVDKC